MKLIIVKISTFIIITLHIVSCYPPKILYSLESVSNTIEDSIEIKLLNGYAITTGSLYHVSLSIELNNNNDSEIFISNSILESKTNNLHTKYLSDKTNQFEIGAKMSKIVRFEYSSIDSILLSYSLSNPKVENHKLFLYFDVTQNQNKINLCVILRSAGTKQTY